MPTTLIQAIVPAFVNKFYIHFLKTKWKFKLSCVILIVVLFCFPFGRISRSDLFLRYPRVTLLPTETNNITDVGDVSQRAGMYTPYSITPGGGERYFLTIALALQAMGYEVDILIGRGNKCDKFWKLKETASALRIPLNFKKIRMVQLYKPNGVVYRSLNYDFFFSMGNSKFPPMRAIGTRANIWMCQFPFDLNRTNGAADGSRLLSGYDVTLVNSKYSQGWYYRGVDLYMKQKIRTHTMFPSLEILYPPVSAVEIPLDSSTRSYESDAVLKIAVLGRFFRGRQSKGHDVALSVIETIIKNSPRKFHLTLIGSVHYTEDARQYVAELKATVTAKKLPVTFITNASPEQIRDALSAALVFWHLTGMRSDENENDPASKEHFGIAIVEAMSVGCIPIVTAEGGPSDIVSHGITGYLASSADDYVNYSLEIAASSSKRLLELSEAAIERSRLFSVENFLSRFALLTWNAIMSKEYKETVMRNIDTLRYHGNKIMSLKRERSAVIVETDVNPLFEFAVRTVMNSLGTNWAMQVFCSERNEKFVRYTLRDVKNVYFKLLPGETIKYLHYNNLVKSPLFWRSLEADKVLLFQSDVVMIRPGIERFLRYDMIGTITSGTQLLMRGVSYSYHDLVANAGLSLRSVKPMIIAGDKYASSSPSAEREDVFFSRCLLELGYSVATSAGNQKFCPDSQILDQWSWQTHFPLALQAPWLHFRPEGKKYFYDRFLPSILKAPALKKRH